MRRFLKISLAVVGLCAFAAAPGQASVKFGSSMLGPVDNTTCQAPMGFTQNCTLALSVLPPANQEPGGTVAPSDGVIVGWTLRSGNSLIEHKVRLRVIRGTEAVATGPTESLQLNAGFNNFLARLPVQAGDKIGIDTLEVAELQSVPVIRSLPGASFQRWFPPLADGQTFAPTVTTSDFELMLNATLEPDADKDGWGDETQDKCVGSAGAADGCPGTTVVDPPPPTGPIPTEAVPDTKIGKVTIIAGQKKVSFRFTATVANATFQCKLDKKPWKPCKSPRTYKGLKGGRHSFKVKAIGPTAVQDPTPAKRSFKLAL